MDIQISNLLDQLSQIDDLEKKQIYVDKLNINKKFYCDKCALNGKDCLNNELSKEKTKSCEKSKVLLTSRYRNFKDNINLVDSVIIDLLSNRLLSTFPKRSINYKSLGHIKKIIGPFKTYELVNGSMFTLYYDNHEWFIHTKNAYNANNKIIYGNESNGNIIYNMINVDMLDRNNCYTFILTHKNIHVTEENNNITFVQSFNLKNNAIEINSFQEENITENNFKSFNRMVHKKQLDNCDLSTLEKLCESAYLDFETKGNKFYGFLIECDSNLPNIIIDSLLMQKMKDIFYDNLSKRSPLIDSNKEKFMSLVIYMNSNMESKKTLLKLFKIYEPYYQKYDEFFDTLLENILRNNSSKLVDELSSVLLHLINPNIKGNSKIIMDIIKNPENVETILKYI